jgi:hypothetical protein
MKFRTFSKGNLSGKIKQNCIYYVEFDGRRCGYERYRFRKYKGRVLVIDNQEYNYNNQKWVRCQILDSFSFPISNDKNRMDFTSTSLIREES